MTHSHHHDRPDGAPVLKVTGLKKAYGAIQAVGGVSFQVQPGEIFGVIGPNGSGRPPCSTPCWARSPRMREKLNSTVKT
jgi:ABC-type phosphonate transport system ATPase subunit